MKAKLYGYWRSSASWRVRWAFELKKIPYDYIPVNILKGEHQLAEHKLRAPLGSLPVLETLPETFLSQSMAILWWIEENFHREPYLFCLDRGQRYRVLELCELINADTAPLQTPRVQNFHSDDASEKKRWARHFIEKGLEAFESLIAKGAGPYCLGSDISAADLFLIPQLYNAKRFGIEIESYPASFKIWSHCMSTEACQKSSPELQIDAVVNGS